MENHEYETIVGNAAAPFVNELAGRYTLLTNYHAITHPSEPNYVAAVSGSTQGITDDGVHDIAGPSLFSQLADAGLSWRAYQQDDGGDCFLGPSASGGRDGPGAPGTYVRKHDPAIMFTTISGDAAQCRYIQPLAAFDPAAASFAFITPNLTNDMHDGSVAQGDAFLRDFVPSITASAAFADGGLLFITFDEGGSNAGSSGDHGGHVATLVIRDGTPRGRRDATPYDHWSLLRTTEDALRLPCLGHACDRSAITY